MDELTRLKLENALLLEGIKFYADFDNYVFTELGKGITLPREDQQSAIVQDMGARAIEILFKIKGSK